MNMPRIDDPDRPSQERPAGIELAVIVVSDFEAPGEKSWKDEVAMAQALAVQDLQVPFEIVFVEHEAHRRTPAPQALFDALPAARVLYAPHEGSAELKDYGVARCAAPWVAVLEADARPEADWLRLLHEATAAHPEFDAFCGRTFYGEETAWQRCLNLLDRSFDDRGVSGPSVHLSNNGALLRTAVFQRFPYPESASPFLSARQRGRALEAAGHRFWTVREARMRHAIGGTSFVIDFRRHTGYSDMMMCPHKSHRRIPWLVWRRMRSELGDALRVGAHYLRWSDWALWCALYVWVRVPELRGMRAALGDVSGLRGSSYR